MANIEQIKQLREETGISISECGKALEEARGDIEAAKDILRKKGREFAEKRGGRKTNQGIIESYIHSNHKIGVLLDIRCETDFVAKSEDFQNLAHEICLQIAATNPRFLAPEDISQDILQKEKEVYREQCELSGKMSQIIEEIVEGKIDKFKKENSLYFQPWIKDADKTIARLINDYIAKVGENIAVKGFTRYEI